MADRPLAVPRLSRRTAVAGVLGSAAATLLAGGCDNGDDLGAPTATGSPTAAAPTPSASAPAQTPDEALVATTVDGLTAALGVLATARKLRPLRAPLAPLVRAHRRHVEVLEGDLEARTAPTLTDPATALRAVRRSETHLQAALADAAGRAESGALARLLASMSASVSQHLAVLPSEVPPAVDR